MADTTTYAESSAAASSSEKKEEKSQSQAADQIPPQNADELKVVRRQTIPDIQPDTQEKSVTQEKPVTEEKPKEGQAADKQASYVETGKLNDVAQEKKEPVEPEPRRTSLDVKPVTQRRISVDSTKGASGRRGSKTPTLPGDLEREGESIPLSYDLGNGVRGSKLSRYGQLWDSYEECKTMFDCLKLGTKKSHNGPFLAHRFDVREKYNWQTYQEIYDKAMQFGAAITHLLSLPKAEGVEPVKHELGWTRSPLGIFMANLPEAIIAEYGCYSQRMAIVPLYCAVGRQEAFDIIIETGMSAIFCDNKSRVTTALKSNKSLQCLKHVIVLETLEPDFAARVRSLGVTLHTFAELMELGMANPRNPEPASPHDLAMISYTSGALGHINGVMLTHRNLLSNFSSFMAVAKMNITNEDAYLSYLPSSCTFEKTAQIAMMCAGGRIAFSGFDIKNLVEDVKTINPAIFFTTPRFLFKIHRKIMDAVDNSKVRKAIFNTAYRRKSRLLSKGIVTATTFWDSTVFRRAQEGLGSKVRTVVISTCTMDPFVLEFARCVLGCNVLEVYGQIENVWGITMTEHGDMSSGHSGVPLPCVQVKLVDAPAVDRLAENNIGEICYKGTSQMVGYKKKTDHNSAVVDSDGWIHSGDLGQWTSNGCLKVLGKMAHMFNLKNGHLVMVEQIEAAYIRCQYISMAFVHGSPVKNSLVAIVVPDSEHIEKLSKRLLLTLKDINEMCVNEQIMAVVLEDMLRVGHDAGLNENEKIKKIHIYPKAFTIDKLLLTPTLKVKRDEVRKQFATELEYMMKDLD